jgi:hypothetical protein
VGASTRLCGGGPGCSCSSPKISFLARRLRLRFQRGVYIAAIRLSQQIWMMPNGVRKLTRTTGVQIVVLDAADDSTYAR